MLLNKRMYDGSELPPTHGRSYSSEANAKFSKADCEWIFDQGNVLFICVVSSTQTF